jgi:hypothetical protein
MSKQHTEQNVIQEDQSHGTTSSVKTNFQTIKHELDEKIIVNETELPKELSEGKSVVKPHESEIEMIEEDGEIPQILEGYGVLNESEQPFTALDKDILKSFKIKYEKRLSIGKTDDLFSISIDHKIKLPAKEWFTDNPIGMFVYCVALIEKWDISHTSDVPKILISDKDQLFWAGFVTEYNNHAVKRPSRSKDPFLQGSSCFFVEVLLRNLGIKHTISALNIPNIYIGSSDPKKPKSKLLEEKLKRVGLSSNEGSNFRKLFRYCLRCVTKKVQMKIPSNMLMTFESAWKRSGRRKAFKQNKKKSGIRIVHAPPLAKLKGFVKIERTFIKSYFSGPWKILDNLRKNWNVLVVDGSTILLEKMHNISLHQWKIVDALMTLGKNRLSQIYQNDKYVLKSLKYEEDFKTFMREEKITQNDQLPPIFNFSQLINVGAKVLINSDNPKKPWNMPKNDQDYQNYIVNWNNLISNYFFLPNIKEEK